MEVPVSLREDTGASSETCVCGGGHPGAERFYVRGDFG